MRRSCWGPVVLETLWRACLANWSLHIQIGNKSANKCAYMCTFQKHILMRPTLKNKQQSATTEERQEATNQCERNIRLEINHLQGLNTIMSIHLVYMRKQTKHQPIAKPSTVLTAQGEELLEANDHNEYTVLNASYLSDWVPPAVKLKPAEHHPH